jgi:capsular polysaccharide biosynthesis protein
MKSSLVLDKVIRDNNIVYKKKWGIIPNKKEGEYVTARDFYGKGKTLKFENIKNTNVITISFKSKFPELAYGVVSSLITNYIELHKDLNTEKSKSDKQLLESEYAIAKEALNKKLNQSSGLPAQSMSGIGNLTALSAFSRSASSAIGSLKGQYLAEEKSQIAINEEKQKVAQLATKLEWAKMVEQMSDSSKVLILHEPQQLRSFENVSPKMKMNIILGIVFGFLASLLAVVVAEIKDEMLTYSMLTDNIILDIDKNADVVVTKIFSYNPKKILVIPMLQLPNGILNKFKALSNCDVMYPDLSKEFIEKISSSDKIILVSQISKTRAETYKNMREIIKNQNKNIIFDVLM